jgi:hypothetical protein
VMGDMDNCQARIGNEGSIARVERQNVFADWTRM